MKCHYFLLLLFVLNGLQVSTAQTTSCGSNMDFELGDFSNWQFFQGSCCAPFSTPVSVVPPAFVTIGRMTVTSGSDTDFYGGFPIVAPGFGAYSFKLGQVDYDARADKARYIVHVPPATSDFAIIYKYAVVMEDPGHTTSDQPRFEISAIDSATGNLIPCGQHKYVAGSLPGFKVSKKSALVYYLPWSTGLINLKAYAGRTIYLDFMRGDCGAKAHFGYGYFDLICGSGAIKINYSNCKGMTSLSAPPGFESYTWMDESLTTFIDSASTIIVSTPPSPVIYKLIVSPFPGSGCKDTLSVTVSNVQIALKDTALCPSSSCILKPIVLNGNAPFKFKWSPSTGLSCDTCRNPIFTGLGTTSYTVSIIDSLGCEHTDSAKIEIRKLPVIKIKDTFICLGQGKKIVPSGAEHYNWHPSIGIDCDTCRTPFFNPASTTKYSVKGTDIWGCSDTSSFVIEVKNASQITFDSIAVLCKGNSTKLKVRGALNYSWSPVGSLSCSTCDSTIVFPENTTTYTIIGIDSNSCKDTAYIEVKVHPPPSIILTKDQIVCQGDSVQLAAVGAVEYKWQPSKGLSCSECDNPKAYLQKDSITYTVMGVDEFGCIDSNAVSLILYTKQVVSINSDDSICLGDSIHLYAKGGSSYKWTPDTGLDNDTLGEPTASPRSDIIYQVVIEQGKCFKDTLYTQIKVNEFPNVTIIGDSLVNRSQNVHLYTSGTNIHKYLWQPENLLICNVCAETSAKIKDNTLFIVEVTSTGGCSSRDSFMVNLLPCDTSKIFIPNTFTPNNDGVNDRFYVIGVGIDLIEDFLVYNRWGQLVFEKHNIEPSDEKNGWDGRLNGKMLSTDTFVYLLRLQCGAGNVIVLKGDISLIN